MLLLVLMLAAGAGNDDPPPQKAQLVELDNQIVDLQAKKSNDMLWMGVDAATICLGTAEGIVSIFALWPLAIAGACSVCGGSIALLTTYLDYAATDESLIAAQKKRNEVAAGMAY